MLKPLPPELLAALAFAAPVSLMGSDFRTSYTVVPSTRTRPPASAMSLPELDEFCMNLHSCGRAAALIFFLFSGALSQTDAWSNA